MIDLAKSMPAIRSMNIMGNTRMSRDTVSIAELETKKCGLLASDKIPRHVCHFTFCLLLCYSSQLDTNLGSITHHMIVRDGAARVSSRGDCL